MNSVLRANDDLMCRERILRREWKLNKSVGIVPFILLYIHTLPPIRR
jgi:hypothetical protein